MLCVGFVAAVDGPLRDAQPLAGLFAKARQAFANHVGNLRERTGFVLQVASVEFDNARGVDVRIDQSGQDESVADAFDASRWAGKAQRLGGRAYVGKLAGCDGEGLDRLCAGGSRFDGFDARAENDEVRRRRRGSGRGGTGGEGEECDECFRLSAVNAARMAGFRGGISKRRSVRAMWVTVR